MQKIALALSLTLAATACGGSSSPTEAASDEVTTTTEAATTTTASPVDVDRYCELAVLADARSDAYGDDDEDFSPEGFESFLTEINGYLAEASEVVDPSISKPFAVNKEQFDEITALAVAADYDIFAIFDEIDALDSLSRFESAEEAVEAYEEEVCGIAPDEDDEVEDAAGVEEDSTLEETVDDGSAIGAVTLEDAQLVVEIMKTQDGLDLVVDGFLAEAPNVSREQASCFLSSMTAEQFVSFAALADVDDVDLTDPSVAEIFTLMDTCDITLADLLP